MGTRPAPTDAAGPYDGAKLGLFVNPDGNVYDGAPLGLQINPDARSDRPTPYDGGVHGVAINPDARRG